MFYQRFIKNIDIYGNKTYNKPNIFKWVKNRDSFIELLCLAIHLLTGAPLRGEELLSI